jgi:hypothetical protein
MVMRHETSGHQSLGIAWVPLYTGSGQRHPGLAAPTLRTRLRGRALIPTACRLPAGAISRRMLVGKGAMIGKGRRFESCPLAFLESLLVGMAV